MSTARPFDQERLLRQLTAKARQKGYLSFQELVSLFPTEATAEETRDLIDGLEAQGIKVRYDREAERSRTQARIRGESALLTREQEVALARQIREGHRRRIRAALRCPRTVQTVIRAAEQIAQGNRRLWDVLADYEGSHPDDDDDEARRRLREVAVALKKQQAKLTRLQSPQAVRKDLPNRRQRVGALRSTLVRHLSQLDFREDFLKQLLQPIEAQARQLESAMRGLQALEGDCQLAVGSLGGSEQISDADARALLRAAGLARNEREAAKRKIKNLKRDIRSACHRSGMDADDLLKAAAEVRRGDLEANRARQAMVEANQRLVISIARRYPHYNMDFLDLVQEGNLGLMRAADRFDPDRGFRFGTYAAWWVRQSIGRLVAEQGSAVRIPPHVQESLHKVNRITRRLVLKSGREPSIEELAEHLGKTPERIKEILSAGRRPVSTETQVGDSEDSARLLDFLPDPQAGPDEQADRRVQQAVLQDAMSALTERERDIIALRFHQGLTLQEVGDRYGITRERTRQLQAQALRKLRKRLKADLLRRLVGEEPFNIGDEPEPEVKRKRPARKARAKPKTKPARPKRTRRKRD